MRPLISAALLTCISFVITVSYFAFYNDGTAEQVVAPSVAELTAPDYDGHVISAKMNNATIKAELGRSSWKLLHTMAAQYPENPTENERTALDQFIRLFSRLYPCGECAAHFQLLLKEYPPQTSSRVAASQWLCAVHNKVNERLHKPIFDCADIQEKYHCGCEEDGNDPTSLLLNIPGLSG